MHGLINRSIQCFLHDTYGPDFWWGVADAAGIGRDGFETMLHYDDALTEGILRGAGDRLDKPRETLLEDLGTFLVSNPRLEALRRLLRFGGEDFVEFLQSLDDLAGRARLAVPDLDLPDLELLEEGPRRFRLLCRWHFPGACHVMMGILRALADDYGALVVLNLAGPTVGGAALDIELLDSRFSEGRDFSLAIPLDQGAA